MTRILWVTGGLVNNEKLAEAIRHMPEKECVVRKVGSVQEAIIELFESCDGYSLIICDQQLEMSIPKRELRQEANQKHIPYLLNPVETATRDLSATQNFHVPKDKVIEEFLSKFNIVPARRAVVDGVCACFGM